MPASAPTCRCSSRPALARSAGDAGLDAGLPRARASADPRADRRSSGRASEIDAPALASQAQRMRDGARPSARGGSTSCRASEFNINSPKQLGEILFDKLRPADRQEASDAKTQGASPPRRTCSRSSRSTHELPRLVLEWRELQKLKGTYVDALPLLVNPATGRVHTTFNQAVAATGRLSSSDPNLQNIPIRTALGREIRRGVRRRAGPRADLGRLLADRAARARASVRRRGADRGVHAEHRHPRSDGANGLRHRTAVSIRTSCGGARRSSTTRCSTAKRRSRSRRTSACRSRPRRNSSTRTSPAFPACARSSISTLADARDTGVVQTMTAAAGSCPSSRARTARSAAPPSARR